MKTRITSAHLFVAAVLVGLSADGRALAAIALGPNQGHVASIFGSVYTDFTTYLDVKPQQRPRDATEHWMKKYKLTEQQLQEISQLYAYPPASQRKKVVRLHGVRFRAVGNKSPLNLSDTTRGAYVGQLIPGMDIGVAKSYGLPGGSWVRITDAQGNPVGRNNGYFRVGDRGDDTSLRQQGPGGGIDFYAGKDLALAKELHKGGQRINVRPVSLSAQEQAEIKKLALQNGRSAQDDMRPLTNADHVATPKQKRRGPYGALKSEDRNQHRSRTTPEPQIPSCDLVNRESRPDIGSFFAKLFHRRSSIDRDDQCGEVRDRRIANVSFKGGPARWQSVPNRSSRSPAVISASSAR